MAAIGEGSPTPACSAAARTAGGTVASTKDSCIR